jgi:hypothetical protein
MLTSLLSLSVLLRLRKDAALPSVPDDETIVAGRWIVKKSDLT